MSPRRISSKKRAASLTRARRGWVTGTHGSSFRSGRSSRISCIRSARSSRPSISYISSAGASSPSRSRSSIPAEAEAETSTRIDVAEPAPPELGLDGLEQVVGVVGDLEVGVARDPEDAPARRSPSRGRATAGSARSRTRAARGACRRRRTGRGPPGTLTRANRSSPVSGSTARTPSESERPEMYGNG